MSAHDFTISNGVENYCVQSNIDEKWLFLRFVSFALRHFWLVVKLPVSCFAKIQITQSHLAYSCSLSFSVIFWQHRDSISSHLHCHANFFSADHLRWDREQFISVNFCSSHHRQSSWSFDLASILLFFFCPIWHDGDLLCASIFHSNSSTDDLCAQCEVCVCIDLYSFIFLFFSFLFHFCGTENCTFNHSRRLLSFGRMSFFSRCFACGDGRKVDVCMQCVIELCARCRQ